MIIEAAQLVDIPQIITLGKQLFDIHNKFNSHYYSLSNEFDRYFESWVKEHFNQETKFILTAKEDVNIIGFIAGFVKYLFPWFMIKKVGHLSFLIVASHYRQKGVGRLLEDAASKWFKSKNLEYVEVYADEINWLGNRAWQSYGYQSFKKLLRKKI